MSAIIDTVSHFTMTPCCGRLQHRTARSQRTIVRFALRRGVSLDHSTALHSDLFWDRFKI